MTTYITGGAGFIGTALAKSLLCEDDDVLIFDSLVAQVHGASASEPRLEGEVRFVRADVTDAAAWDRVLPEHPATRIIHLAAETGTGQSLTSAHLHTHTNVDGTAVMLDALSRNGCRPSAIVLASSRAVYGEGKWLNTASGASFYAEPRGETQLEAEQWDPLDRDGRAAEFQGHDASCTEPRPTNVYAATKLAQEHLCQAWCASFGVPLSILRLQNVYGAGQTPLNPYTGVLTYFARQIVSGEVPHVFEGGGIVRDFVHVSDAVAALHVCVSRPPKSAAMMPAFRRLDIGSGQPITLLDAARTLAEVGNGRMPITTSEFRLGDVRAAYADISRATAELDWRPTVGFSDGAVGLLSYVSSIFGG